MNRLKLTGVLVLLVLTAPIASAQKMIVDHSFEDLSFLKFKGKLIEAIVDKDTTKLFAMVYEEVKVNSELPYSSNEFKQVFRDELYYHDSDYDPYAELLEIVSKGFRKNIVDVDNNFWRAEKGETVFQAPSYQSFIAGNQDIYLFVLTDNVNVREKPTIYSKVVGNVSQERLKYTYPDRGVSAIFNDGYNWVEVTLRNGTKGYIADKFTSLQMNKELSIKMVNGEWKIISYFTPVGC